MRESRALMSSFVAAFVVLAATACRHAAPAVVPPPPDIPSQQLSPPLPADRPATLTSTASVGRDTANEKHVDIDTHGAEVDVRTLLDFVAAQGGFSLVYSPKISRKVRVQLNDVPVSVALQTLLAAADLTIETATPDAGPPGSTSVVFYQLPVNVDSLSVDAIMKRFGVGRTIAEMIVKARTNKP